MGACSFKWKQGFQGRKRQGRQIDGEKGERCTMQFQVQAGALGKKTSGAPNWRRKGREGCHAVSSASRGSGKKTSGAPNWRRKRREGRHAVSSASRGSREENVRDAKLTEKGREGRHAVLSASRGSREENFWAPNWRRKGREMRHAVSSANRGSRKENVRGAKLTEKRMRGTPCSFKCKQGLQGRKRQGRQIDGEKENKSSNCQTYFPFGFKIRHIVFLNSIIMMLVSLTFLMFSTTPRQCSPWVIGEKSSWYRLDK